MFDSLRLKRFGIAATELLPVIAIVAVLGAIVIPQISGSRHEEWQHQVHQHYVCSIDAAVARYHSETGAWPSLDLSDIAKHPDYFPEGIPNNPVTGAPYVLDPKTYRVE